MATKAYDANRSDYKTPQQIYQPILNFVGCGYFSIDVCCTDKDIPATFYFTKKEDGLAQRWAGRCFMNPPYNTAIKWVRKAEAEVAENMCEVCAVLPTNRTEVLYYQANIFNNPNCVFAFLPGKQGFIIPDEEDVPPVPSIGIMIVCFTKRAEAVEKAWNEIGLFNARAFRGGRVAQESEWRFDI